MLKLTEEKWPEPEFGKWTEKLKKELKTEDFSSKTKVLDFDVQFNAFQAHSSSIPTYNIKHFPRLSVGLNFVITNEEDLNTALKKLLQFDLQTVKITTDQKPNWEVIFTDVYLDMINVNIDGSNEVRESWEQFRGKSTPRWSYDLSDNLKYSELSYCLKRFFAETNDDSVTAEIGVSENLLEIIPFARALRIYFEQTYPDRSLILSAISHLHETISNENDQLIRSGSQAMFCHLAGFNHIYFKPVTNYDSSSLNHSRLLLNIQNLMALESRVLDVKDALSGSDVIDDLTQQYLSKYFQ